MEFVKYPKTFHIEGSKYGPSDSSKRDAANLTKLQLSVKNTDCLLIEEKMDGSQLGIFFSAPGCLQFQSRGTLLSGGECEAEYSRAKSWAYQHCDDLWLLLGVRYVLFGEWLYLKNTIFYDQLPGYFMEYDIYDRENGHYLSTRARADILAEFPFIPSVRVIAQGSYQHAGQLAEHVGKSAFISSVAKSALFAAAGSCQIPVEIVLKETDISGLMEGLYIKVEKGDKVSSRFKFVRGDFITKIVAWFN